METFLAFTFSGLFLGAAYSIAASGLVLTYTTTRVFNLAHGATSMVMAYLYWELHVHVGIPTVPAVALILFVIAPLYGIVLQRVVMRGLGEAPVSVSLVVTVALFVLLVGVAQILWPTTENYYVSYFLGSDSITVLGVRVLDHYLITMLVAVLVAAGLYVLLNRTRIGTAMRASVDNSELLALFGASANRVSMLSWALGSSLAALAGVLLVSYTGLDYYTLTFLVVASFAAAMLGRLASLPLTFAGSIALGLGTSYLQGYVHGSAYIQTGLQTSLPTFMLFATVLFVPQVRLRVGQVKGILAANVPTARRSTGGAGALVVAGFVVVQLLGPTDELRFGLAACFAIVMLSLVLLTGYGGYVSLAQFTFVGVGALVAAKADTTSPLAIVLAVLITAAVGAVVALPVLRLTGLYLALATLAFAQLMDNLIFRAGFGFGAGVDLQAKRVSVLGYDFHDTGAYVFLVVVVFAVLGLGVLALRRGPVGRLLIALRDSPAACETLGLDQRWFRIALFSASAGVAGLAGALYAGLLQNVDATPFSSLESLPLLLVAVVAGVTTVSGAFAGGVVLMLIQVLPGTSQTLSGLTFLVVAVGAILLARDPNGLVNVVFRSARSLAPRIPVLERFLAGPGDVRPGETDQLVESQVVGHGAA